MRGSKKKRRIRIEEESSAIRPGIRGEEAGKSRQTLIRRSSRRAFFRSADWTVGLCALVPAGLDSLFSRRPGSLNSLSGRSSFTVGSLSVSASRFCFQTRSTRTGAARPPSSFSLRRRGRSFPRSLRFFVRFVATRAWSASAQPLSCSTHRTAANTVLERHDHRPQLAAATSPGPNFASSSGR